MASGSSGLKPLPGEDYTRSLADPEVISLLDEAKQEARGRIESVKDQFASDLNRILEDFREKDFADQLSDEMKMELKFLDTSLTKVKQQSDALTGLINNLQQLAAAGDVAAIKKLANDLSNAASTLDGEIAQTRKIWEGAGAAVGKAGRKVASSFIGGLL